MTEELTLYRVQFINDGERYELYVKALSQGALFGFVEIKSDKGHDSFLLDVPDFLSAIKNFLDKSYTEN